MEDRLPSVSIRIDVSPREFLKRVESILTQTGDFEIRLHENIGGEGFHVLDVIPRFSTPHEELFGQIVAVPDMTERVGVEARAVRWKPEPPTYNVYVEATQKIFEPLLRLYNATFSSRRRLTIQSKDSLEPKLSPRAKKFFNEFVVAANKNVLHPNDWKRFYRFTYICSARNTKLTQDDVRCLLTSSGFSPKYSEYLADIFEHGRNLLRRTRI